MIAWEFPYRESSKLSRGVERSETHGLRFSPPCRFPIGNHQERSKMIPAETSDFASLTGGIASLNHRLNNDDALRATGFQCSYCGQQAFVRLLREGGWSVVGVAEVVKPGFSVVGVGRVAIDAYVVAFPVVGFGLKR